MIKSVLKTGLMFLLVCWFAHASMWAQGARASISGVVQDPSGAFVPDSELSLRALGTGAVGKTTSGPDGYYAFENLLSGAYDLTVTAKGFREFVQRGISLNLDQKVRVDIKLELGATVQTVEISANASPLNFESPVQKGTIQPKIIEELPLILGGHTRTAVAFARLLPGVTTGGGEDRLNFNTRINGGVNETDEAILDGITIVDGSLGQNGIELAVTGHPLSPEAVQEVTLLTANYDPQYGQTSSSVLTAVTKSGTNEWHGALYDLERNTSLNARQFGITKRPKDLEHDFGGNIGGPLKVPILNSGRKKTYFFVNYEGFRIRGATVTPILSLPTLQERAGDFRDWVDSKGNLIPIFDPDTTRPDPNNPGNFIRDQFMGCDGKTPNVICPSDPRLAKSLAPAWFKFLPPPNRPGVLLNWTPPRPLTGTVNQDSTVLDVRGDTFWRDKDHFSVTVHYFGSFGNAQTLLPEQISTNSFRAPNVNFADRLNWDHTFRANLVNNFNLGYNDILSVIQCVDASFANLFPKIPGVASTSLPPAIGLDDFVGFGCNSAGETTRPAWIANDRLAWVRGRHTIEFGGEYRGLQDKELSKSNQSGSFSFSRLTTGLRGINSGNSVASFLLGDVSSARVNFLTLPDQYIRQKILAWYVGDTWKATPKLTLNFGVRWDVSTPTVEKRNRWSYVDPNGPNPGAGNRPGQLVFAGRTGGAASSGRSHPEDTWTRGFAPRIGIAYAVSPKTVVRAGYGIFYQQLTYPGWNSGISGGRDGFNNPAAFTSTNGGITPALLLQDGLTGKDINRPPFFDVTFDNGRFPGLYREFNGGRPPYSQQWNLTIEHQFTGNFHVSTAYVANKGTRLISALAPLNALNPQLLSLGNKLFDEFQPGQASLDGVPIPYAGWVDQLRKGQCAPSVAQALLPFPQFCGNLFSSSEDAGNSTYNSFQVKAEKRFSQGFWMLTSYTASKFISSGTDQQVFALPGTRVISPFERKRNKALDVQDVPQTLSVAFVYQLPFGSGQRFLGSGGGVLNKLVSGWQVNSIVRAQSGIPFFFRSSQCNIPGQFAIGCIPGILPGSNPFLQSKGSFDPGKGPIFNAASFENGNNRGVFSFQGGHGSRITNLRGFGFKNHDFALEKITRIGERMRVEFRAEFFNIWNLHYFSRGTTWGEAQPFITDLGRPDFGKWTGQVSAPRNIQFAAKIIF